MNLLVIGDPERKEKDMPLVESGSSIFGEAVYVPVDEIRIELEDGTKLVHNQKDLDGFDYVLPVPTRKHYDMFISVIEALPGMRLPYKPEAMPVFQKNIIGLAMLKNLGFMTSDVFFTISEDTLKYMDIEFPVEVMIGAKVMHAENKRHLINIAKMRMPGQGIMIKQLSVQPVTECLIAGDTVIASLEYGRRIKRKRLENSFREHLCDALKFLGSEYGSISFCENKIISVSLSPDFSLFNRFTKGNATAELLAHIKRKLNMERNVLESIIELLKKIV